MTTPATAQPSSRRARILFLLGLAAAIAALLDFAIYRVFFAYPTHDQAWYLYAAGLVLSGTKLYGPLLTDVDPPCIIWFSMLPRLVGYGLHIAPLTAMKLVVTAMMVASAAWSARILRAAGAIGSFAMAWLVFAAVLAIEGSLAANFGQREHLLVILLAPYVLLAVCGSRNSAAPNRGPRNSDSLAGISSTPLSLTERVAIGIAAGAAICFKPQDTLIVIGLEVFLLLWTFRQRTGGFRHLFRSDLLALVLTAGLYNLLVWLLTPLYFHQNIPMLVDTYWTYGEHTFGGMLRETRTFELAALLTLLLWVYRRRKLRVPLAPLGLLAASISAFVAYCAQRTGFGYQAFPQNALLTGAVLWLLLDWFASWVQAGSGSAIPEAIQPRPSHVAAWATLFFAVSLPLCMLYGHRKALTVAPDNPFLEQVLSQYPAGTPVYDLSTGLMGFDHVFRHNLVWGGRYAHLWMLPSIAQNEAYEAGLYTPRKILPPERVRQLAEWQRTNTAADLGAWKPAVVLVETCTHPNHCQAIEDLNFDTLAWFMKSPAFAAQWSHYRRQSADGQWVVYTRVE